MKINGKSPRTFEQYVAYMHKKMSGKRKCNPPANPSFLNIFGANPPFIDQEKQRLVTKISQQGQQISHLNRSLCFSQQEVMQLRNRIQYLEANICNLKEINKVLITLSQQQLFPSLQLNEPQRKRQKTESTQEEFPPIDLNTLFYGHPKK